MSERLQVVCTPIGNLQDLSPRAEEALKRADIILAEDTRTSRPLLDRIGTSARLVSCHQHNEEHRAGLVLEALERGERVCLISDAGAPGISDPGGRLVDVVSEAGHAVEVLPGPSAVVAALMGAGLISHHFAFLGFLPKKRAAKERALTAARASGLAVVLYEAPSRIEATLDELARICGPARVVVARELTKKFETFHRGVLGEALTPPLVTKGEIVVVVEAPQGDARPTLAPTMSLSERMAALRENGELSPKKRAQALAKEFGLSSKDAYDLFTGKREVSDFEVAAPSPPASSHSGDILAALEDAVQAFIAEQRDVRTGTKAGGESLPSSSGNASVDDLLAWLGAKLQVKAPVEAAGLAKALLAALNAAEELEEAEEMMADVEQRRRSLDDVD